MSKRPQPHVPASPALIEPMTARLVDKLPDGKQGLYEVKLDLLRAAAIKAELKKKPYFEGTGGGVLESGSPVGGSGCLSVRRSKRRKPE